MAANRIAVLCVNDRPDGSYQFTARELIRQLGLGSDVIDRCRHVHQFFG
ncbi:hypothetical protein [Rhizobium rhizogenes]